MMGAAATGSGQVLNEFSLGDCIPKRHLLRRIDLVATALPISRQRSEMPTPPNID